MTLLAAALLLPAVVHAQVSGGCMSGIVSDSSAAPVISAEITISNTDTGIARKSFTNANGVYSVPNLVPGHYSAMASSEGFSTLVKTGIVVTVGGELQINFQLKLGDLAEKVVVNDAAPGVELTSSTISVVVNDTVVRELPLNGRDWTTLATLQPGVETVRTQPLPGISNQRANRGLGTQLSIDGNRPEGNNYRIDGISINDYSNGAPGGVLGANYGVDAVQEFSVITTNPLADYGRTSGGVINAATRSGTDSFHGSVYEFLRNSDLDARNFFDKSVPPFKRNQFGGTGGGPIRRGKTFFFADYEGLRQSLGSPQLSVVPSAAARNGQLAKGTVTVDPRIKPYLDFYPLPNGSVSGDTGIYNFSAQQVTTENLLTTRVDHRFSALDTLSGTYLYDSSELSGPSALNTLVTASFSKRQLGTVNETHLFTPSFLNSVRAGVSRVVSISPTTISAINPLVSNISLGFVPGLPAGLINISGLSNFTGGLGAVGEYDFHYNSDQVYDDAYWTHGNHQLKFGANIERIQANQIGKANPNGQFIFGSLTNFLTDKPQSFNAPLSAAISTRDLRSTIAALYVQDEYRLRPNFGLNLGLRYEMSTVPTETAGRLSALLNPTDATPHIGSPYFQNPTKANFEPRLGFVWDPFGSAKTSVRGGFGMFDVLPLPYQFEINSILSAPFFEQGNIVNLSQGTFPSQAFGSLTANKLRNSYIEQNPHRNYVMEWNFSLQQQLASGMTASLAYAGSHGVHNLFRDDDFNIVLPTLTAQGYEWPATRGSGTRLNPNVGQITGLWWQGSSVYDSLQAQIVKRFTHGLQFGVAYTWGKSIDDGSASVAGDNFSNSVSSLPFYNSKLRRALSDFDIRHNLVANYNWDVPNPKNGSALLWAARGWTLGGIYQLSSGLPFTGVIGGDPLGLNSADTFNFPDRVSGSGCSSPVNPGIPTHYINTSCFAFPNPGTRLGNAGRNDIIGPSLSNLDISLFKNNRLPRLGERVNAQFRVEAFNILNHSNFAPPLSNRTLFSATGAPLPTAGVITSTATASRQIQVALKLIF